MISKRKNAVADELICRRYSVGVVVEEPCCNHGGDCRRYRRIAGDSCEGGESDMFDPLEIPCPLSDEPEFMLYCTAHKIHRRTLESGDDVIIPTERISEAVALDYDYANHCVFWSDPDDDVIKVSGR